MKVKELERILLLVEELELEMVEEGVISNEGYYSNKIGEIKESIYNEISETNNSVTIDTEAGFQGQNMGDGMSGFRG